MARSTNHPAVGKRVEIPPHFDVWMRGARFGRVIGVVGGLARVQMDHPQVKRPIKARLDDLRWLD